jgi:hypothetical protein
MDYPFGPLDTGKPTQLSAAEGLAQLITVANQSTNGMSPSIAAGAISLPQINTLPIGSPNQPIPVEPDLKRQKWESPATLLARNRLLDRPNANQEQQQQQPLQRLPQIMAGKIYHYNNGRMLILLLYIYYRSQRQFVSVVYSLERQTNVC